MRVNFNPSDFSRRVANSADLMLRNRYYEENPSLTEDGASLLARPGLKKLIDVGEGPIRGLASEAGSFGGDLFIASGADLYRMKADKTLSLIFSGFSDPERGVVNMAITAQIGNTPEYLFIADGNSLLVYVGNGYAYNTLTGGPLNNNDVVRIDNMYYKFTNASVNAGTPAGTSANPWLVKLGINDLYSYTNLFYAINNSGVGGSDYSSLLQSNPSAVATSYASNSIYVRARTAGVIGNAIISTTTSVGAAWTGGGTFTGGGVGSVSPVMMPEDVGAIDVKVSASYVIVLPVQDNGMQGRFYWIDPGETVVDPLNFATAERSPDGVFGIQVFGDQFWLPGETTTEVWYVTGEPTFPMRRLQGVVFDRGAWENTSLAIHETMVVVDADGGVFLIKGGSPQRVSNPGIEEQIRKSMARQRNSLF